MYIRKGNANSTSFLLQAFETVIHFLNNLYNRLFLEFREPFNGKLILLNHFFSISQLTPYAILQNIIEPEIN